MPNKSPEPTAVGAVSSAIAGNPTGSGRALLQILTLGADRAGALSVDGRPHGGLRRSPPPPPA